MAITTNYFRVYTKAAWDGNPSTWQLRRDLEPVTAMRSIAPNNGQATLRKLYGQGAYEDNTPLPDGGTAEPLAGQFVRITRADNAAGQGEQMLFAGVVPADGWDLRGQSALTGYKAADQIVLAVELDRLLNVEIARALVVTDDVGTTAWIDGSPVFNRRTKTGGIAGNKSGIPYMVEGIESPVFEVADYLAGTDFGVWSAYDIIDYLRRFFPIAITADIPAGEKLALLAIKPVLDPQHKTVKRILDELLPPGRGIGWCLVVGLDDTVTLKIFSQMDQDLTVGEVTLPVHLASDTWAPPLWTDDEKTRVNIEVDANYADSITVRGGKIKACGTFDFASGTLDTGWTADDQDLYIAGVSASMEGYSALPEEQQAFYNDRFRDSDRMGKVFTTFVVPKDFDWRVGFEQDAEILNPEWDPATGTFKTEQAKSWPGDKRFLPFLPFREGWDYTGTVKGKENKPVNNNRTTIEAQWRRAFAIVKRGTVYEYADKMRPRSATVEVLTDQPGMVVRFSPQHLLGLNHYDPATAAPSQVSDDSFGEKSDGTYYTFATAAADYETIAVTAMIETDQEFKLVRDYGTRTGRPVVIDVPDAELWIAAPGTVFDIDVHHTVEGETETVQLKRFGCKDVKLRDDTKVLESIMAAAQAWYGRKRYRLTMTHPKAAPLAELGTLVLGLNIGEGYPARGSCVSAIVYNFGANTVTLTTAYAELKLPEVYGQAPRTGPSHSADRSEMTGIRRRLDEIEKDLSMPRRIGQNQGAGGGVPPSAFCKVDAGSGNTIACYLDTYETGEEITVTCKLSRASNLSDCFPLLAAGDEITVYKDGALWKSYQTFIGKEDCS